MSRVNLKAALLAFSLLIVGCQNASQFAPNPSGQVDGSIVGGEIVNPNARLAKQVANITFEKRQQITSRRTRIYTYGCTGTFIARKLVLAAAHCFENSPDTAVLRFHGANKEEQFETKGVRYILNSDYLGSQDGSDDLALMETQDPLPEGFHVTTLAESHYRQSVPVVATGFGLSRYVFSGSSARNGEALTLKYVNLKSSWELKPWYRSFEIEMSKLNGISVGDSGGPLFVKDGNKTVQIGVASGIYPYNAVYASVAGNIDWIRAHAAEFRTRRTAGWKLLSVQGKK